MKWTMKRKLKIARYDKYKYSGRPIPRRPKRGSTQSIRWANWIFLNARFKLINKTFDSKLISPSLLGFSSHGDYWPLFPSLVVSLLVTDSRDKCLPCLPTCNSIFPRVKCMGLRFKVSLKKKATHHSRAFWYFITVKCFKWSFKFTFEQHDLSKPVSFFWRWYQCLWLLNDPELYHLWRVISIYLKNGSNVQLLIGSK